MNTIDDPLAERARASGEQPALISSRTTFSYRALYERVRVAERVLRDAGIEPGDRVGLFMEKHAPQVLLLHTLFHMGAVAAPVSTRIPLPQAGSQLSEIGARRLLTDVDAAAQNRTGIETLHVQHLDFDRPVPPLRRSVIHLDAPATIVHTSGSSGRPKPVLHSYGNHYYSARGSNQNIPLTANSRWLLTLPLYHVGGLAILFRCLVAGTAVVIPDTNDSLAASMARHRPTHASLVSTQLRRLLAESPADRDYLQAVLLGGGSIPGRLINEAADRRLPIHVSYGLTEMSSQVTATPPDAPRKQLHTSGKLLPYREMQITEEGEIIVRGRTLFTGYVAGDTLDTARDSDGWYHTGDLGRIDDQGFLHVTGRKDNMFISGGENIHPEEIESALEDLPAVEAAAVVPVRDDEFDFRPVAFVRWHDQERSLAEVRDDLSSSLARFKLPIAVFDWADMGSSAGLKIDRERLQKLAERRLER